MATHKPPAPLLIAESGASKTEWRWLTPDGVVAQFRTQGFNLNVMNWLQVANQLENELMPMLQQEPASAVVFYGASLATESLCNGMAACIRSVVQVPVVAHHDLLGAARAALQDKAGVVCIMGTGSNSCRYDGKRITEQRGGHGYVFGDEGSGADLGKRLVQALLNGELLLTLAKNLLEHTRHDTPIGLRNMLYGTERPNVALANLTHFMAAHRSELNISALIHESFTSFLQKTACRYRIKKNEAVWFTGSIAQVFQEELLAVCRHLGVPYAGTLGDPIDRLVVYHQKHF